jgi:hypothetical protein
MPETSIAPPSVSRPSKPASEALLNEKVSVIAFSIFDSKTSCVGMHKA